MKNLADGGCFVFKARATGFSEYNGSSNAIMNLSPWFKPTDPPVRAGSYQIKDFVGRITWAEWDGAHFMRGGLRVDTATIRAWRGLVKP